MDDIKHGAYDSEPMGSIDPNIERAMDDFRRTRDKRIQKGEFTDKDADELAKEIAKIYGISKEHLKNVI